MIPVLTPRDMDGALHELGEQAVSDVAEGDSAGLLAISSWDARELLLADERSRATGRGSTGPSEASLVKAMDVDGRRLATWLSSMSRDGYARERALARLALESGVDADRLIALRLDDPVDPVRIRAWEVLASRFTDAQVPSVVPILVRLSGRLRVGEALSRYESEFRQRQGTPMWEVLVGHSDRATRRWAFEAALGDSDITTHRALKLLGRERDQWVTRRLVETIETSGDVGVLSQLLASRHALARAAAISSLPDSALDDRVIVSALFDRAATVRAAARHRALGRGIAAGPMYRRAWHERRDPRALVGAALCGEQFDLVDVRAYLNDPDPRVRSAAVELLAEPLADEDAERMFVLLEDPHPGPAGRAVRALAGSDWSWSYQRAAALWDAADPRGRARVWRLLSGRGGWDRVRADLLAASDAEPGVSGLGRADL